MCHFVLFYGNFGLVFEIEEEGGGKRGVDTFKGFFGIIESKIIENPKKIENFK